MISLSHADFMAAICADRDSDTPRLIYADWLEEQGDTARAEFIRVQCELAGLPECVDSCRSRLDYTCRGCILRWHEHNYLFHNVQWAEPVAAVFGFPLDKGTGGNYVAFGWGGGAPVSQPVVAWEWRRGFVAAVRCDLATWLAVADALTAAQPVEAVTIHAAEFYQVVRFCGPKQLTSRVRFVGLLKERWPSIRFDIPPAVSAEIDFSRRRIREVQQRGRK